jgi:hypothetical protein
MLGNDCEPLALLAAERVPSACLHGTQFWARAMGSSSALRVVLA